MSFCSLCGLVPVPAPRTAAQQRVELPAGARAVRRRAAARPARPAPEAGEPSRQAALRAAQGETSPGGEPREPPAGPAVAAKVAEREQRAPVPEAPGPVVAPPALEDGQGLA